MGQSVEFLWHFHGCEELTRQTGTFHPIPRVIVTRLNGLFYELCGTGETYWMGGYKESPVETVEFNPISSHPVLTRVTGEGGK
jgi:hypothetical protein